MSLITRTGTADQHQRTVESWIEELNFYETEIRSCELSLEQLIHSWQKSGELVVVEQFQNQFIHQREVINDIKHRVRQYLRALPSSEDGRLDEHYKQHFSRLSEEVNTFRKLFNEMLLEFDDFLKQHS